MCDVSSSLLVWIFPPFDRPIWRLFSPLHIVERGKKAQKGFPPVSRLLPTVRPPPSVESFSFHSGSAPCPCLHAASAPDRAASPGESRACRSSSRPRTALPAPRSSLSVRSRRFKSRYPTIHRSSVILVSSVHPTTSPLSILRAAAAGRARHPAFPEGLVIRFPPSLDRAVDRQPLFSRF